MSEFFKKSIKQEPEWFGTWPAKCDICGINLSQREYFIDGVTTEGYWALMCPYCYAHEGRGLGTGRGQKYNSETRKKMEG